MRLNWNNLGRGLEAIADARQRVDLAKAYGLTPQEQQAALATPEQLAGARAETQALQQQDIADFGLTPQEAQRYAPTMPQEGQRVGLSTYRLGDQTFQQAPTQAQLDTARMRAAADVYGRYGDAAKREELMRGLRAEERATAAETRAQTGFETQQQEANIRLRALGRSDDAETRYAAFSQFAAQNPNMTAEQLRSEGRSQFKLTPEQELKYIQTRLGLEKGEFEAFDNRIKSKLKGKNLTQLGSLYNSDPDFDDNTDLAITPGKNGSVTLTFIDKKTNKPISTNSFGSEALAVEYLNKQAVDPVNTGSWLLGVRAKEASIAQAGAATQRDIAAANRYERISQDESKRMTPEQVKRLNELSIQISEAEDAGKGKDAAKLRSQWEREYITAAGGMGKVVQPKAAGLVREMSDLDKENLKAYRTWEESVQGRRASPGERDKKAAELGVTQFVNRTATPGTGLGSNPYGE